MADFDFHWQKNKNLSSHQIPSSYEFLQDLQRSTTVVIHREYVQFSFEKETGKKLTSGHNLHLADGYTGDSSLYSGDKVFNEVSIRGDIVNDSGTPTGQIEDDDSTASVTIEDVEVVKSVYAINGLLYDSQTDQPLLAPGGTVTYRIKTTIPSGDMENVVISDYLPLPTLNITENTD